MFLLPLRHMRWFLNSWGRKSPGQCTRPLLSAAVCQQAKSILLETELSQNQDSSTILLLDVIPSCSEVDRDPLEREAVIYSRGHSGQPGAYQVNTKKKKGKNDSSQDQTGDKRKEK